VGQQVNAVDGLHIDLLAVETVEEQLERLDSVFPFTGFLFHHSDAGHRRRVVGVRHHLLVKENLLELGRGLGEEGLVRPDGLLDHLAGRQLGGHEVEGDVEGERRAILEPFGEVAGGGASGGQRESHPTYVAALQNGIYDLRIIIKCRQKFTKL
jgi:hypothetical protein